jgi:hypothetical protein
MNQLHQKQTRILAIAPSSRGFGFAVLEEEDQLIDWGLKTVERSKTSQCLRKVEILMTHYAPTLFVLEDHLAKDFHRCERIRTLNMQFVELSIKCHIEIKLITHGQLRRAFFGEERGTKYRLAEILAEQFPTELRSRLPPKRLAWKSEDSRMAIFDAVALVLAACLVKRGCR